VMGLAMTVGDGRGPEQQDEPANRWRANGFVSLENSPAAKGPEGR